MANNTSLNAVDGIEILTLQDNYIEITATDHSDIIRRAVGVSANGIIDTSIQAEHGFAALVNITANDQTRTLLFDFGFLAEGAAYNARKLGVSMNSVEQMALSHGHSDHFGGFDALVRMIEKPGIDLVLHPGAFKYPRYLKFSEKLKAYFPRVEKESIIQAGCNLATTADPYPLLDGNALFLGEVERTNDFEKGFPIAFCVANGVETWDPIEDDTSIVMNLKGKGLVVLSGCAHAGIVNSVNYARKITGIDKVHAVMGGFHLSGPLFEPIIGRTTEELKKINPDYVVPCHCTGRKAIMNIEREMPDQFILNMSGTKLTFKA